MNEEELINYYQRRIKAIEDEMEDLSLSIITKKHSKIALTEVKREYKKLQEEKEFMEASLDNLKEKINNKGRKI